MVSVRMSLTVGKIYGFFVPQFSINLFNDISPFRPRLFVILHSLDGQYIGNLVYDMVWVLW